MNILGISASPRPEGNTDLLLQEALLGAREAGMPTELVALRHLEFSPCAGHSDCRNQTQCVFQDDVQLVMDKFLSYDSVIIATPVYYWNVTASLKSFIDRHYFYYTHKRNMSARSCGIILVAASSGLDETEHFLRRFLVTGARYGPGHDGISVLRVLAGPKGAVLSMPSAMQEAREFGRKLVVGVSK